MSLPALQYYVQKADDDNLASAVMNMIEFAQQTALARHQSVSMRIEEGSIKLLLMPDKMLTTKRLNLKSGRLSMRSYPRYRDYLVFHYSGSVLSDNATIWYSHKGEIRPVWSIVIDRYAGVRLRLGCRHPCEGRDLVMEDASLRWHDGGGAGMTAVVLA